jgi:hypothetical protein
LELPQKEKEIIRGSSLDHSTAVKAAPLKHALFIRNQKVPGAVVAVISFIIVLGGFTDKQSALLFNVDSQIHGFGRSFDGRPRRCAAAEESTSISRWFQRLVG